MTDTRFQPGLTPWNKNLKGIHLSPGSEFKKGQAGTTHVPVGTESIVVDKSGKPRVHVKVAEPNRWRVRAQLVWEREHGIPIPSGHIVHHENRDTLDDSPSNLALIERGAHMKEHRAEFEEKRRAAAIAANRVPMVCVETGRIFASVAEAAAFAGVNPDSIAQSIRRGNRSGGYHWRRA